MIKNDVTYKSRYKNLRNEKVSLTSPINADVAEKLFPSIRSRVVVHFVMQYQHIQQTLFKLVNNIKIKTPD